MSLIGLGLMVGGITAVDNYLTGSSLTKEALRKLEEFEPQQLVSPFEGLTPSQRLEQEQLSEISQSRAGALDVAQGRDAASALAITSMTGEQTGEQQLKMYGGMAKEQASYDIMKAQDKVNIRSMQEQREQNILGSLQEQLAAGRQMRSDAMMGFAKQTMAAGLAREDRLAGLGQDPLYAAQERIKTGDATGEDYLMIGDYQGYLRFVTGLEEKANN